MFKKCKRNTFFSSSEPNNVRINSTTCKVAKLFVLTAMLMGCEQMATSISNMNKNAITHSTELNGLPYNRIAAHTGLPLPTKTLSCQEVEPNQNIVIKGQVRLAPLCDLKGQSVRFTLQDSNTSLDCNGAILSPNNQDTSNRSAITIRPKHDQPISNISVANCHIEGYGHALHIRQNTNPNTRYSQGLVDPKANRDLAPHHIQIINLSSHNSTNSGIFVGDHVHHVNFDKLYISRAGTVGLYFEFGSQNNRVENSVFADNGYRSFKPKREAIAVDSSSYNQIVNNQFIHNGAGAIYLYRNCFEHANDNSRSNHFKRTQSAANNTIKSNTFRDEPVGVWVASRQSRNLKGFQCGAYLLADTPLATYHLDSAKDNKILDNKFINVDRGVIVEDNGTQIIGNDFTQVQGRAITVGSRIRKKYADRVEGLSPTIKGTVIERNLLPK